MEEFSIASTETKTRQVVRYKNKVRAFITGQINFEVELKNVVPLNQY